MFGAIGTVLVIAQMAALSTGFEPRQAMAIGFIGSLFWIAHARKHKDVSLLITNATVGGFALWGLV